MLEDKENFKLINNFIEKDFIEFIQDYFSIKINSNQYDDNFENFNNGYEFYGDPLMETILQNSCKSISELIGINLVPTYSITNMFMKNDYYKTFNKGISEFSAVLLLGSSNLNNKFSINFTDETVLDLSLGDLIIFKNKKLNYKEFKISEDWILQSSLNFVDSEGDLKDNIYDNRLYLGFPMTDK